MNARISNILSRLTNLFEETIRLRGNPEDKTQFHSRHAEHLVAAGFGFPNWHGYLTAVTAKSERCCGYYLPDTRMIISRMSDLGYSGPIAARCPDLFAQAVTNGDGSTRAEFAEDLEGERLRVSGSQRLAYNSLMHQNLTHDVLDNEDRLWSVLARFGIEHDREAEDNLEISIDMPPDFPSLHHLGQTVDLPITAVYDLDQGSDQEALFHGDNRQLGFRGNLRLKPSGKRGWAYPTLKMNSEPFVDGRNAAEIQGNFQAYDWPDIDKQKFDDGYAAGRAGMTPAPQASFDWLAGWVMVANGANATGHMSTGLVDKALAEAMANASTLDTFSPKDVLELAAQACRSCASTRNRRSLEEIIQEQVDRLD
ncbi:hypothetical protein [Massilia sp. BJB1822]|uniref:hypothetical protein n=1 Tax=Massilia sp. BJB1822 TaxID=2744470 RepID=UPI001592B6F2|nr:hypothetical protein [Massilia sp. BJB1822]NVD97728.1 hypothetical protein [Massilia sp. BJB1822]